MIDLDKTLALFDALIDECFERGLARTNSDKFVAAKTALFNLEAARQKQERTNS